MERTIYKYPLSIVNYQSVKLPLGAEILCIKNQGEIPCLWALVDPKQLISDPVQIRCVGTGHELTEDHAKYIDTVLICGGAIVLHFFKI